MTLNLILMTKNFIVRVPAKARVTLARALVPVPVKAPAQTPARVLVQDLARQLDQNLLKALLHTAVEEY